jgi:hypothetical protein
MLARPAHRDLGNSHFFLLDCPSVTSTGPLICSTLGVHSSTPYFTTSLDLTGLVPPHPSRH